MSKASQRRQAAQRKRETEVRGSPEKRLRMLVEQDLRWEAPARFWRECVKHLPADAITPSTEALDAALERAKPLIQAAAANWTVQFEESGDDPDEVMPGVLMPFLSDSDHGPRFDFLPFSLFGRAVADDTDLTKVVLDHLSDEWDGALWVFGSVVTARGETFVLAVHRDGTLTASVRVAGQWVDRVPTFMARAVAHMTAALMVDERGTEAMALIEAVHLPLEEWSDLERRTAILREVTSDAQTPYLSAMWRLAMVQLADSTASEFQEDLVAYAKQVLGDRRAAKRNGSDVDGLRAQLQDAQARVRALQQDLQAATQARLSGPADTTAVKPLSAAKRLSGIF